jgi:choline dehydrogenase-like flavoprotein
VTDVVVEHNGGTENFAGNLVVVACGAANTARLLLASANDKHPNGLANGSDQVGRNFMFHDSVAVLALSREENPTVYQKTLGLNDFYFGSDDFEYPLGNIQMVGKSQAPMFHGRSRARRSWHRVDARARCAARDRLLALDRGPTAAENRVSVDGDGKLTLS